MFNASTMYGATPQAPSFGIAAPTAYMGTDDIRSGLRGLLDPNNPLVWLGGILVVTVGMAGVAGSVRLGRAKLSASLDQA